MPVTLSIKNAPDDVVERLRHRAAQNHRSLQGELMVILKHAVADESTAKDAGAIAQDIVAAWEQLGMSNPSESAQMIREDRDR